jgi:integrase
VLKRCLAWAVKKGQLRTHPAIAIEAVGTSNRGKPQLRLEEARELVALASEYIRAGQTGPLSVLCCLVLGTRISEILNRTVRDLEDKGRVLVIEVGKTPSASRRLIVPEEIRPWLVASAKNKMPHRPLIRQSRSSADHWVRRLCREAGLPVVCLHSLRGLHAALAVLAGVTGPVVASAIGHKSFLGVTVPHYLPTGTVQEAASVQVVPLLFPGHDSR